MDKFSALMISKGEGGQSTDWVEMSEDELMEGDVTVRISHTTINYKDGLAITWKAPVIRRWTMIPGVDFAGIVERSSHGDFKPGDRVLNNGWGLGESHYGGYAQKARVLGDRLLHIPENLSAAQTMAIGTAGYTAMLCVMALEHHGVSPDKGPVIVSGAAGGVGSVAVSLLAKGGFEVVASTGRMAQEAYLKSLGAASIIARDELSGPAKPLGKERWAGAVDVAGSHTLANIISQTKYGGVVTACGLAQGLDLPATVAPFILRNVTLQGVESVMVPQALRRTAWDRLARDLDLDKLGEMTTTYPLSEVVELAPKILAGQIRGRTVLEVS